MQAPSLISVPLPQPRDPGAFQARSPILLAGGRSDPTRGPAGMVSLIYKGGMPPAPVLKRATPRPAQKVLPTLRAEKSVSSWTDRKQMEAAESRWETTIEKKEGKHFLQTKSIQGDLWALSLAGRVHTQGHQGAGKKDRVGRESNKTLQSACKKPTNPRAEAASQADAKPPG